MSARTVGRNRSNPPVRNPLHAAVPAQPAAVPVEQLEADALIGDRIVVSGPPVPVGVTLDESDRPIPRTFAATDDRMQVVGLHGGAGASSVARLIGGDLARDAGTKVPMGGSPKVLFVARTHGAGVAAVHRAARAWASGSLQDVLLVGLVLIDDGPRLNKEQQQALKPVLRLLPNTWRLGWVEAWRLLELPDRRDLSVRTRRSITGICAHARSLTQAATAAHTKESTS